MFQNQKRQHVAKCPRCGEPHHYTEIKFPAINDRGSWVIQCGKCPQRFVVHLRNPVESDAGICDVVERFDDEVDPYDGDDPPAGASAVHNLQMNREELRFDYESEPIYRCAATDDDLESAALGALVDNHSEISSQIAQAMNLYLAQRAPEVDHAVITVPVPCKCGEDHRATFYSPFRLDGSPPPKPEEMLLAHISGCDLADRLTGILTKSYLMGALEKLIIRWRLLCDQIVIAVPFIGHQFKTKEQRLEIWERLLAMLDPDRTVLLTRPSGYGEYKKALLASGLDHDLLAEFGLENRIVSAGNKKRDFHAKVYVGVGERCEVLSGSPNIVEGPSLENASFAACNRERVDKRYLEPLGVKLPEPPARRVCYRVAVELVDGRWRWKVAEGPVPPIEQ
jgi:hypothetical protein